ncbi:hypothetical protein KIW84_057129 [Lathyrus oleraceus]|uniref:Uncharacterized protein n=1 Tax=Pisum sativum TaxID=3888 RepID=A0A9D4X059_PEA|nr:hypothetical protein KIW84_057129 [Pisum sativum]
MLAVAYHPFSATQTGNALEATKCLARETELPTIQRISPKLQPRPCRTCFDDSTHWNKTINSELWHAYVGPLVSIPPVGSLAVYFPQGHGEQVAASMQKEAKRSNAILHKIITEAISDTVGSKLIGLVKSRAEIPELLKLDDVIDLVIPRGSNKLVSDIKSSTKIPVLGHADGICHVYVDKSANLEMAKQITLNPKKNKAISASDSSAAVGFKTQAKYLSTTGAKLLHCVTTTLDGVYWKRPQTIISNSRIDLEEKLQDLDIPIRGMDIALSSGLSFPVGGIDEELRGVLLDCREQISQKLDQQAKCFVPFDVTTAQEMKQGIFNKYLSIAYKDLPTSFFLYCVQLLVGDVSISKKTDHALKKAQKSGNCCQWCFNKISELLKNLIPSYKGLIFAFKSSLSLGLAVLLVLLYDRNNAYWSGLTIAISFVTGRQPTFLVANSRGQEGLVDIQEAILRQLDNKDLTVVQAALNVDGLQNVLGASKLIETLQTVLRRCVGKLLSGSTDNVRLTGEVAVTCLKKTISYFHDHSEYLKRHSHHYLINGFAVLVTQQQAERLSSSDEVSNVVLDFSVRTAATHTPQCLGMPQGAWSQNGGFDIAGEGVVIGFVDIGIDPSHPSISDNKSQHPYPVPAHFSGICEVTRDFPSGSCNRKLVGARHFTASAITRGIFNMTQDYASPFDGDGHGTHTASVAAGNHGIPVIVAGHHFGNASLHKSISYGKRVANTKDPIVESELIVYDEMVEPSLHKFETMNMGSPNMERQESSRSSSLSVSSVAGRVNVDGAKKKVNSKTRV